MKKKLVIPMVLSAAVAGSTFTSAASAADQPSHVKAGKDQALFMTNLKSKEYASKNKASALQFLQANKAKFGMNDPANNFTELQKETDQLGMTHVKLQQTKNGVPIEGVIITVHFKKDGEVASVTGYHNPNIEVKTMKTAAAFTKEKALKAAKKEVSAPASLPYAPKTELVVYPYKGVYYTAYKVNMTFHGKKPGNWYVYVDASSGKIIDKYNAIMDADVKDKKVTGTGIGVKGDFREGLHMSFTGDAATGKGTYTLKDTSHSGMKGIETYTANNSWDENALPGTLYKGDSLGFKLKPDAAAVDAHYNSEKVYNYYKSAHNRNSIDGKGGKIMSTVHFGEDYANAFWDGYSMTYGDGDNVDFIPLSAALDVAAHEMTHGVTTNSADLVYRGQSGALNEAFSDIFGAIIDDKDWEMGEDAMAPKAIMDGQTSLRSLSQPDKYDVGGFFAPFGNGSGKYPKHMSEYYNLPEISWFDNGGVHINSSIINHAAYLAGEQIGREKLGKIHYRALTVYLSKNSNFSDARKALIQSATDLYKANSAEVKAITAAYDKVGIK
ncbi:neutral protease [Fictibacillus macauensis ZFHKF-1]|uniref:Neutral metalloproteinase n=1 Tax=Fictibacillus macauensis ZFHKF-1 TaxID=1196324 RepID=I8ALZ0_9BACL|nr:M4 family metallopeptidase [Fictibacillus macauensis]EIT86674.1 neutral protease [Fictibacillus macauensis ZFHKF-1]